MQYLPDGRFDSGFVSHFVSVVMCGCITTRCAVIALATLLASSASGQDGSFRWPGAAKAAVALAYDDGVDADLDSAMPDLEASNLRGTFYVSGSSASLNRRMEEWRAAARRGHELGNHTMFHACLARVPEGERTWVTPERALENYTVARIAAEIRITNTLLYAVDGRQARTLAYSCGDETAGGVSYVDAIRQFVPAARAYKARFRALADPRTLDPYRVPTWAIRANSGEEMIAWVEEALRSGSLAVFTFHMGAGPEVRVSRAEHRKLLSWLDANRDRVWTEPFVKIMGHVAAERKRLAEFHP
jgi:peptidoglycan/xylan/chitin deacetylase (PgdA/CDA1 family)